MCFMLSFKEEENCASVYILKQVEVLYELSDDVRDHCSCSDFSNSFLKILFSSRGWFSQPYVKSRVYSNFQCYIKWHAKLCCMYSGC